MAWDSTRSVPWQRLMREWVLYVGIASVVLVIYFTATDRGIDVGLFVGLLSSGPIYLLFGAILAKFGYQRKTMRDLRAERDTVAAAPTTTATSSRPKPAPTRRTSTGPSQHRKSNASKRK